MAIPKVFITRIKPSVHAFAAYYAIKHFAASKTTESSTARLAALVGISVRSFQRGVEELQKKKAVRVHPQTKKLLNGNRRQVANLYEILDLQPKPDDKDYEF